MQPLVHILLLFTAHFSTFVLLCYVHMNVILTLLFIAQKLFLYLMGGDKIQTISRKLSRKQLVFFCCPCFFSNHVVFDIPNHTSGSYIGRSNVNLT